MSFEVSKVKCDLCGHEWVAVRPEGVLRLECPNCGNIANFENIKIEMNKTIIVRIMPNTMWAHSVDEMSTKAKRIIFESAFVPKENEEYGAELVENYYKLLNKIK